MGPVKRFFYSHLSVFRFKSDVDNTIKTEIRDDQLGESAAGLGGQIQMPLDGPSA